MSFWGIEVKPGKAYIHRRDNLKGRLHVSQATLGNGKATEKCLVQCNVGTKCPVFLCSLFPSTSESCQLNLEFDEPEDVVFSVIGPRSVHLCGYFVAIGRSTAVYDDSESYGEDISQTESERFSDNEEDEYGGSFIDDGDPEAMSLSSEGGDDEISGEKKTKTRNQGRRRLKKKYQLSDSSEDQGSQQKDSNVNCAHASDSEADDWFTDSSLVKKESTKLNGLEMKAKPCSPKEKTEAEAGAAVISDDERQSNLQSDHPVGNVTVDAKGRSKLKRRKQHLEDADGNSATVLKDEETMDGKYTAKTKLDHEDCSKPKKRKKQHLEVGSGNTIDGINDEKALNGEERTKVSSGVDDNSCVEKQPKAKKTKKKKKKTIIDPKGNEATTAGENKEVERTKLSISEVRMLSNGVSFEEQELGVPDGKIAVPGKKIKIKYAGMLKESGQVFDSTTGHALKFRLGSDDIIDGLNVGLDGMRVGGKRRLVIPPSMGFSSEGFGNKVPPDSWLVYDVELVGVH